MVQGRRAGVPELAGVWARVVQVPARIPGKDRARAVGVADGVAVRDMVKDKVRDEVDRVEAAVSYEIF